MLKLIPLKSQQPLGALQRKILFVLLHSPHDMMVREVCDILNGSDHSPKNRKHTRRALKGLARRGLTMYRIREFECRVWGIWDLTPKGRDVNIEGFLHQIRKEAPDWFKEVLTRIPPEHFFKTLDYALPEASP